MDLWNTIEIVIEFILFSRMINEVHTYRIGRLWERLMNDHL